VLIIYQTRFENKAVTSREYPRTLDDKEEKEKKRKEKGKRRTVQRSK